MGGEIPSTACKPVQHEGTSGSRYKEVSGGVLGALLVMHGMWNLAFPYRRYYVDQCVL